MSQSPTNENSRSRETEETRLERLADLLLSRARQTTEKPEYPYYSERWLREMRRREEQGGREVGEGDDSGLAAEGLDYLLRHAPLQPQQRQVLLLRAQGLSLTAIARELNRPHTTVSRWQRQGLQVLRRSCQMLLDQRPPAQLIREAFVEQTRVTRALPEKHCRPGYEACRLDGRCKFRWYLQFAAVDE